MIGGGNFFRGAELHHRGMDRARADYMGMLGTVMNCLALQDFLEREHRIDTRVQTAITMGQVAEAYIPRRAIRHLEKGRVVIFGAGVGMPFFSTDTAGAQRALEIGAEVVLLAKSVDGVFTADPQVDPDAKLYDEITHREALEQGLKVADATAFSLCMDNKMPIIVFNLLIEGNIARAVRGERIGTLVSTPASAWKVGSGHDRRDALRRRGEDGEGRLGGQGRSGECPHRPGDPEHVLPGRRRLLRRDDPDQPARLDQHPRGAHGVIKPYDASQLQALEKAIRDSDLGLNPSNDGQIIRVVIPQLSEERRREMVKVARGKGEDARVTIRNIRRKAMDELHRIVRDGEAGEDEVGRAEKELQGATDRYVHQIDDLVKHKETELLEV